MKLRSVVGPGILVLASTLSGCTREDPGQPPAQQYNEVMAEVRTGQLSSAYAALLPSSYREGLDDVFSKLGQLIDEDEYTLVRDAVSSGGMKVAGMLSLAGVGHPVVRLAVDKFRELPVVLGIETYERFKGLSVPNLLEALERGFFKDLLAIESVRQNIESVRFELKEQQRDWARLIVTFQPPDADALVDEMELIRVEGRWVPAAWVTDWPAMIETWKKQLAGALKAKAEAPAEFREKTLAAILEAVKNPAGLLQTLPELRKQIGLAQAE